MAASTPAVSAMARHSQCQSQPNPIKGNLGSILQRKRTALQSQLATIPPGHLEQRIQSLQGASLHKEFAMLDRVVKQNMQGKTCLVVEVSKISPHESKESLIDRCRLYASWGNYIFQIGTKFWDRKLAMPARFSTLVLFDSIQEVFAGVDVLAVSAGDGISIKDLPAVCNAVDVPILWKDWIIHPIQLAEAREAGASAIMLVHAILRKGITSLVNIAGSVGLDAVIEVVNLIEIEELSELDIPVFGINISVGIKLPVPGIRQDIAKSLIKRISSHFVCIVGISTLEEATLMRLSGADAVYVRHEIIEKETYQQTFLENLKCALTGDDINEEML